MKDDGYKSVTDLKAQLEIVEREKESLLKVVAHDLRSPLNKLFALVGLFKMSDGPLSDEQVDYLNKMELVIADGLSKMRNLMDLRLVDDNRIKINYELIDLSRLIKKTIGENQSAIERKNMAINYQGEKLRLETDGNTCLRIFDQLLSNAIKYSPIGSEITINIVEDDDWLDIYVVDGGYGIEEEEHKLLFSKFKVLSTRTTGGESATGIGLYIAQKMALHIGGKIRYENNDRSKFILRLPKISVA